MRAGKTIAFLGILMAISALLVSGAAATTAISQLEQITGQRVIDTSEQRPSLPTPAATPEEKMQSPVTLDQQPAPDLWSRFSNWIKNTFAPEKPKSPLESAGVVEATILREPPWYDKLSNRIGSLFGK